MALDQLKREGNPPAGQLPSPVPQYQIIGSNPAEFENAEGSDGASHHKLMNASGTLINPATEGTVDDIKAAVESLDSKNFATEAKLEQVRVLLNSIDGKVATQTTSSAILALLDGAMVDV